MKIKCGKLENVGGINIGVYVFFFPPLTRTTAQVTPELSTAQIPSVPTFYFGQLSPVTIHTLTLLLPYFHYFPPTFHYFPSFSIYSLEGSIKGRITNLIFKFRCNFVVFRKTFCPHYNVSYDKMITAVSVRTMKAHGDGGINPFILNIGVGDE
jgi:hypothetical protein